MKNILENISNILDRKDVCTEETHIFLEPPRKEWPLVFPLVKDMIGVVDEVFFYNANYDRCVSTLTVILADSIFLRTRYVDQVGNEGLRICWSDLKSLTTTHCLGGDAKDLHYLISLFLSVLTLKTIFFFTIEREDSLVILLCLSKR